MFFKFLISFCIFILYQLVFTSGAYAWGPAIHTVIACSVLDQVNGILPLIAAIIKAFPLEYIYGNMAADFFIGKGQKKKEGHSHNWETGFRLLSEVKNEEEASYAYGFLSHLAADIVAHNYFIPDLIHRFYALKRIGHIYSEALADRFVGPFYMKVAREVLSMDQLDCDDLLRSVVGKNRHGLKARRQIFTQTVKLSEYLFYLPLGPQQNNSGFHISNEYLIFMIQLSYRLARDVMSSLDSSPCVHHDPIGSYNLKLASSNGVISRVLKGDHTSKYQFPIHQELLNL